MNRICPDQGLREPVKSYKDTFSAITVIQDMFNMSEPRYLVYRSWNGQIHTSIEYGSQYTGEGIKKDPSILKSFKIENPVINNMEVLKKLYPLEIAKDE